MLESPKKSQLRLKDFCVYLCAPELYVMGVLCACSASELQKRASDPLERE